MVTGFVDFVHQRRRDTVLTRSVVAVASGAGGLKGAFAHLCQLAVGGGLFHGDHG